MRGSNVAAEGAPDLHQVRPEDIWPQQHDLRSQELEVCRFKLANVHSFVAAGYCGVGKRVDEVCKLLLFTLLAALLPLAIPVVELGQLFKNVLNEPLDLILNAAESWWHVWTSGLVHIWLTVLLLPSAGSPQPTYSSAKQPYVFLIDCYGLFDRNTYVIAI